MCEFPLEISDHIITKLMCEFPLEVTDHNHITSNLVWEFPLGITDHITTNLVWEFPLGITDHNHITTNLVREFTLRITSPPIKCGNFYKSHHFTLSGNSYYSGCTFQSFTMI